jgi:hypothetical protein
LCLFQNVFDSSFGVVTKLIERAVNRLICGDFFIL